MSDRFFVPELFAAPTVRLEGAEAHHLSRVRRLAIGDAVELFDGAGGAASAEITAIGKNSVELLTGPRNANAEAVRRPVELATAIPKGDRFRWLVEKATELGVDRLLPLRTERSVVHPGDGKLQKMQQAVIAACKQSGRNRLMAIEPTIDWVALTSTEFTERTVVVAHPTGDPIKTVMNAADSQLPLLLVVGPEGGLTDREVQEAVSAGARLASLGQNILRIETAGVMLAAISLG